MQIPRSRSAISLTSRLSHLQPGYAAAHEVRDRGPAVLRRRRVRPGILPWVLRPSRGARLRERLDPGIDAGLRPAAQPDRSDDLRGRVYRADTAGVRGVRVDPAQPGAP